MILSLHAAAGAVLASSSGSIGQAIVLGIVSHYFLDSLPHIEYGIENVGKGNFKMAGKEFAGIAIDLLASIMIALYMVQGQSYGRSAIILIGAFFALIPDGLGFLDFCVKNKERNIFTKFLKMHSNFHKKIHSTVLNKIIAMPSQIIIVLILAYAVLK